MLAMIYPDNYPAQFPFVIKDFVATRVTRSFIELSIWSFLFSLVAPPKPDYGETITVSGINMQCRMPLVSEYSEEHGRHYYILGQTDILIRS